jgi:hypothetical protein
MSDRADKSVIITPTQEDIDNLRGYRVGQWREHKNYKCIYCQYSTLWISKMEKHQREGEHPWAYPGQNPAGLGAVSEDGPAY